MSAAGTIVRDVLGRERPVARTYEDGSHDCPFCTSPAVHPAERCSNPWCPASDAAVANPGCAPRFQVLVEEAERKEAEEKRRRADAAAARARAEEARTERARQLEARAEEAARRGACERCATEDMHRTPRYVRHRNGCPKRRSR